MTFTLGAGSAASAHANFVRSDPAPNARLLAPPARVIVGFAQKIVVKSSGLVLIASDGSTVTDRSLPTTDPTELVLPLPALVGGVYAVAWNTVSAEDGDPASGYFAFTVGAAPVASGGGTTLKAPTQSTVTTALNVVPLRPGENTYTVFISGSNNVTRVRLRITPSDRAIGMSENILSGAGGTTFRASGFELPFVGRYHIEVQVRRSDSIDDLAFGYDVAVASAVPSPSPSAAASSPVAVVAPASAAPAPTTEPIVPTTTLLVGGALVLLAAIAGILVARRRT